LHALLLSWSAAPEAVIRQFDLFGSGAPNLGFGAAHGVASPLADHRGVMIEF
jgi:hypothetical protein